MTSIATAREPFFGRESGESDLTASNPATPCELRTGRALAAWAGRRGDESQSQTFRALAWSQDDDAVAEPLPYLGGEYWESTVPVDDAVPADEAAERASAPRYRRRSTLLYGVAAGLTALAVGGLVLTVLNADTMPATTYPVVIHPAENGLIAVNAESSQTVRPTAPAQAWTAAPARAVSTSANTPSIMMTVPEPTVAAGTPDAAAPVAPEVATPQMSAPEVTPPEAAPPVAVPPVVTPPIVSVPEVTPQQVPHPVGPLVIHVPVPHEVPVVPLPDLGGAAPPVIQVPAAPAASNPVITLDPVVIIPPGIPLLSGGAGH